MQQVPTLPWQAYPPQSDTERIDAAAGFLATMRTRRTCRAFSPAPVDRAIIEAAIRTAGTAPSGANHQPWHFAVIASPAIKAKIRDGAEAEERDFYAGKAGREWLGALAPLGTDADKAHLTKAPWLIVVFGQRRGGALPSENRQNYYVTESVGIATGLMLASLHLAGIATLTHTPNPMKFLNALCDRPDHEKPLMIIAAGHPASDAVIPVHATLRKPLDQIASWR